MSIVTLAEAKTHLNIGSGTSSDAEVQTTIDAAESAIVRRCGPLSATNVTERVRGARRTLTVAETPILALVSIAPAGGSPLALSAFTFDGQGTDRPTHAGTIEYLSGGTFPARWYDVTYSAGWADTPETVPADLKRATLALISYLWEPQRLGGQGRPGSAPPDVATTMPGAEDTFPLDVERLLGPFEKG